MSGQAIAILFKISLIIFLIGNLSSMGLQLEIDDALRPLRRRRFVVIMLLGSFVYGPIVAAALLRLIPLDPPYAAGLALLSLAPAAPFLPLAVKTGRGDLSAAAAFMLLASLGTVVIVPLAVPHIVPGMSASAWAIAKPLLLLMFLPMALGMFVRHRATLLADRLYAFDKVITNAGTAVFLALVVIMNFRSVRGAIGSYALATEVLFVMAMTAGGYLFALALPRQERVVMSLGMCTRNIGAVAAIVGSSGDQRVMVMLVMAALATVGISFAAAAWFGRSAGTKMCAVSVEK